MKKGFTLAEVLITLGIIGVVAALTIPALLQNYQKRVYVNQLRKATAELTQAFRKIITDTGCYDASDPIGCTDLFRESMEQDIDKFDSSMRSALKIIDSCVYIPITGATITQCNEQRNIKSLDASSDVMLGMGPNAYIFKTVSGYEAAIFPAYTGQGQYVNFYGRTGSGGAASRIDINGEKGPNQFGRDVFEFVITRHGVVVPMYSEQEVELDNKNGPYKYNDKKWNENSTCDVTKSGSNSGRGCFARIEENGWVMDY